MREKENEIVEREGKRESRERRKRESSETRKMRK